MYTLVVSGFKNKSQVEAFIRWYEGQGEQSAVDWFDARKNEGKLDIDSMPVDCQQTYPINWDNDSAKMILKI